MTGERTHTLVVVIASSTRRVASAPSVFASVIVDERDCDAAGIAIPRAEIGLVVRMGPSARDGLDVYAMGVRTTVQRKLLPRGQRTLAARLRPGTSQAVLGVPASALSGDIVALEDLWGRAAAQQLHDRLGSARDLPEASAVLDAVVSERLVRSEARDPRTRLALEAATRLSQATLRTVAAELGLSERHLRRLFHDVLGVSPKAHAKLARFGRALNAARAQAEPHWAHIAASAGYYDQAHLIAEFRAVAGATPRALLRELRTALAMS